MYFVEYVISNYLDTEIIKNVETCSSIQDAYQFIKENRLVISLNPQFTHEARIVREGLYGFR